MKHAVLALLLLVATWAAPGAQSAITGRVVTDESGDPVTNARVVANAGSSERVVTMTDRDGRFSLPVSPGRHGIVATKPRFARGQATVDAGAQGVEIRLRRGAAISGRIIDEFGDPVVAAAVFVETRTAAVAGTTITDDRGEYRIGGLSAGTFNVAVRTIGPMELRSLGRGRFAASPAQIKTYYPNGTTATESHSIDINWGDERAGVDLVLPAGRAGFQPFDVGRGGPGPLTAQRLQAARAGTPSANTPPPSGVIRGIVTGANGLPLPYAVVRLDGSPEPQIVRTLTDGRFEFRGLPRGPHRLSASKVGYFSRDLRVPLQPGETIDDRSLVLEPWGIVTGRVFDEYGDPVQGTKLEALQLRYEGGRRRLVSMSALGSATDDHGSFRLFGLRPGQYILSAEVGSAVRRCRSAGLRAHALPWDAGRGAGAVRHRRRGGGDRHRFRPRAGAERHRVWTFRQRERRADGRQLAADAQPAFPVGDGHTGWRADLRRRAFRVSERSSGRVRHPGVSGSV